MFSLSDIIIPLCACFILVGIHAYLGVHVLARKVIFVDLALAQIAALGAVYALFLGLSFDADPLTIKLISVLFSFLGALIISLSKIKNKLVPHEALIGVIYATALSLTLLLSSNLAHGADEIRQLLSGSILWVSNLEIIYTSILYIIIGLIHFIFRKQFFAISYGQSISHKFMWDILFYITFGIVVTSSVGIGGVLLVFGYLIIPSIIGVLLAKSTKQSVIFAWIFGVLASIIGLLFSYYYDLPSGPCIVITLAIFLVIILISKKSIAVIIVIISTIFLISYIFKHEHEENKVNLNNNIEQNISLESAISFLQSDDYNLRFKATEATCANFYYPAQAKLLEAFLKEQDLFLKIEMSKCLGYLGDATGVNFLSSLFVESLDEIIKQEAYETLKILFIDQLEIDIVNKIFHKKINFSFDKKNNKFKIN